MRKTLEIRNSVAILLTMNLTRYHFFRVLATMWWNVNARSDKLVIGLICASSVRFSTQMTPYRARPAARLN